MVKNKVLKTRCQNLYRHAIRLSYFVRTTVQALLGLRLVPCRYLLQSPSDSVHQSADCIIEEENGAETQLRAYVATTHYTVSFTCPEQTHHTRLHCYIHCSGNIELKQAEVQTFVQTKQNRTAAFDANTDVSRYGCHLSVGLYTHYKMCMFTVVSKSCYKIK